MSWSIFPNDGNFKLNLQPGSLPLDQVTFLIASPWGLPGVLPSGLDIVGEAYEITAANNVANFEKLTTLSLRFDAADVSGFKNLAIYRWNFGSSIWESVGGSLDAEHQEVSTTITDLGLYALLGERSNTIEADQASGQSSGLCQTGPGNNSIYLPWIVKN